MKKLKRYRIHMLISITITFGFLLIVLVNSNSYRKIIVDDIRNITKLTSTNIYSEINNELTKPIFVSLTMANDSFVKGWLEDEKKLDGEDAINHTKELQTYLAGYRNKYQYNSVFLVSEDSKNYYHYKGIHKQLDYDDPHDIWYSDFIGLKTSYKLDVDIDQAASNSLTVFVNCRIETEDEELLGVAGVGLAMDQVQTILGDFEDDYDLEAFLINSQGLVQVHTNDSYIESYNVFESDILGEFKGDIVNNRNTLETFKFQDQGLDGYIITRYIDELDWYLVVKKDTSLLKNSFMLQMIQDIVIIIGVLIFVVFLINQMINKNQVKMSNILEQDSLTNLLNRRGFDSRLNRHLSGSLEPSYIFVLDIDNFKLINDTYGHLFGDKVIRQVAREVKKSIGEQGIVARWGGDEFAGIIKGEYASVKAIMDSGISKIQESKELARINVSVSIGVARLTEIDTPDTSINKADKLLYQAKQNGKNQALFE